jgi:CRP-like cAMP-binding protein
MPFPNVSNVPVQKIFSDVKIQTFVRGEVIIHADEDPKYIYQIDRGFVKAYNITYQGFINLLTIFVESQLFPLPYLLKEAPSGLYYEAMDDVSVRKISRQQLLGAIERDPELAQAILGQVLGLLQAYGERIENLEFRSAEARVVNRLLFLTERYGLPLGDSGIIIHAPIHHQDIADSVNASRETVSRILSKLARRGTIGSKDHFLVIRDPVELAKILDSGA